MQKIQFVSAKWFVVMQPTIRTVLISFSKLRKIEEKQIYLFNLLTIDESNQFRIVKYIYFY